MIPVCLDGLLYAIPRRRTLRAGAALAIALCARAHARCTPEWSSLGTNIDGVAKGLATARGNPGSPFPAYLVAAGGSDVPGTVFYRKVALWDGWSWRVPGGGLTSAWMAFDVAVPPGPGAVNQFYVAGQFAQAGTVPVSNVALWSAGEWSSPGGGIQSGYVTSLFWCDAPAPLGPALYAGGDFGPIGDPMRGLARWDGEQWTPVGGGIWNTTPLNTPSAKAFALYDDDGPGPRQTALYIGGPFRYAGGVEVVNVARWDGTTWEPLGTGTGADVRALQVFDHDGPGPARESLFVAGGYNHAGGVFLDGLGRWDGQGWYAVPGWTGAAPHALAVFDDDGPGPNKPALFVAGISISASGVFTNGKIVKWDGQQWDGLAGGVTGSLIPEIFALEVFDEDGPGPNPGGLYAAGWFDAAGGIAAPRIARWGCPHPPRCDANCNRDFHPVTGQPILNVFDFGCFQTRFVLKDPYGDCNQDAAFTVADFGCFQTKFVAGCP